MSRPLRIEFPGALFHVTCRGNEQRDIFRDDSDRRDFLDRLGKTVERFKWSLTAYVLMSNHFHLLVQLTCETLERGMRWLNGGYAQAFNQRHGRVGHLFQGRPDERLIEKETYFLNVLRYVVLNPVRAQIVERPEDFEWSSYRATAGLSDAPPWLDVRWAVASFDDDRVAAQQRYAMFVNDNSDTRCPWDDLRGQIYLGSEAWVKNTRDRVESKPRDSEHPLAQRRIARDMSDVVAAVAVAFGCHTGMVRNTGIPRMVAAWIGSLECLLPNAAIAAGLRLRSAGHISRLVKECEKRLAGDMKLREDVDRCRTLLYVQ